MLLAFRCQDCGETETHEVDKGSVAETLEWWNETVLDYLCENCEMQETYARLENGYYLD